MMKEAPSKKGDLKKPEEAPPKSEVEHPAAGGAPAPSPNSGEELTQRLEQAEKEAKEHYDRLLRLGAEFENYKKRMAREKEDYRKFSNEALLKALLPVVDNLERALHAGKKEEGGNNPVLQGVELTLTEILAVFEKFAVKPISALHEPFDPAFHQAMMQEASETYPANIVVKELQKGYLIHDRLLRPAMVVVSKGPGKSGVPPETEF